MKQRMCVETDISRHVHGARAYAGLGMPSVSFVGQQGWLKHNAITAGQRPLGLAGDSTG